MSNHTFSLASSILCLVLAANHASAQDVSRDANERKRLAWFVQTSIPEEIENPVKVLAGGEIKMLSLYDSVASQPVLVPEDGILRIVKEVPNPKPDAEEKTIHITLAKAVVPRGGRQGAGDHDARAKARQGRYGFPHQCPGPQPIQGRGLHVYKSIQIAHRG
jgi:hypothetical protein